MLIELRRESIQLRRDRIDADVCVLIGLYACLLERAREAGELAEGHTVARWTWHGQSRHERGGDMRGDLKAHQVIGHKAVQKCEKAVLAAVAKQGLETEDGVSRD